MDYLPQLEILNFNFILWICFLKRYSFNEAKTENFIYEKFEASEILSHDQIKPGVIILINWKMKMEETLPTISQ